MFLLLRGKKFIGKYDLNYIWLETFNNFWNQTVITLMLVHTLVY